MTSTLTQEHFRSASRQVSPGLGLLNSSRQGKDMHTPHKDISNNSKCKKYRKKGKTVKVQEHLDIICDQRISELASNVKRLAHQEGTVNYSTYEYKKFKFKVALKK